MIDIKLIRENPELVKENIRKKFRDEKLPLVDEVLKLDGEWRKLKHDEDDLRSSRNKISLEISKMKKSGEEEKMKSLILNARGMPEKIEKIRDRRKKLEEGIKKIMLQIPNIIHESVPIGRNDSENREIKKIGKPRKFNFPLKSHVELGEELGMLDCDYSAKISGNGFYFLKGDLALLNVALINFARDFMVERGFEYVEPPLMIRREVLEGVFSKEDIENMTYGIDGEDLYLIATSEHPLIGQFINRTLAGKELPVKQTGYSMCFRKEIGSSGIDEKGIYRTHQFNKQEMIVICRPEESYEWYDGMLETSVDFFRNLKLPFRILECCSGDLADIKAKSCDLEAWSPRQEEYFEITSLTNMEEAQARRLNVRIEEKGRRIFAHTLNNTVIATSRALVAIMENNQQKDGSIKIPKILHKYVNGKKIISRNL